MENSKEAIEELEKIVNHSIQELQEIKKSKPKHLREGKKRDLLYSINAELRKSGLELVGLGKHSISLKIYDGNHDFYDTKFYDVLEEIAKKQSFHVEARNVRAADSPTAGYHIRFYGFYRGKRPNRISEIFLTPFCGLGYNYLLTLFPGKNNENIWDMLHRDYRDKIELEHENESYKLLECIINEVYHFKKTS